ncbi:MAG: D-Ala-D-Ala carboxypeptidase family metallohydrolase [Kangiellaceae bacterium]|nr:D-Ala-D-Ala carboxypeptidase family metallohydrolase [Kangiellaceae bacterium]
MENSLLDLSSQVGNEVTVHSGTRTTTQNASIPGAAPTSQHVAGDAADISISGQSGNTTASQAANSGEFSRTNLYSNGRVHVDQKSTTNPSGYFESWQRKPLPKP